MDPVYLFWWGAFALTVAASVMCSRRGIQPNPMYRLAHRLAAGANPVSVTTSTTASCAGLSASLIFGALVYYLCLRGMGGERA